MTQETHAETSEKQPKLPDAVPQVPDAEDHTITRKGMLEHKQRLVELRQLTHAETRGMRSSAVKSALYQQIRDFNDDEHVVEQELKDCFIPQHGPSQFISPRAFFVSALFRPSPENAPRVAAVRIDLPARASSQKLRYEGPELKQSDALVFMTLLNMMRDVRTGTSVSIQPSEVCKAIFGRYDGHSRTKLQEHIARLQKGVIIFETLRINVQLCLRFEYPKRGPWIVCLDPDIVKVFQASPETWLRMAPRLSLPNGLATWLFSYIEAQTRLIPMQIRHVLDLCGSDAEIEAFSNRLRVAMAHLSDAQIVEPGWSVKGGLLRWKKSKGSNGAMCAIAAA